MNHNDGAVYAISRERLAAVRRAAVREAAARPAKGEIRGGFGVMEARIPRAAFLNAVVNHGVDPQDTEYWRDMARLYPECSVKYTSTKTGLPCMEVRTPPGRNRFGRVTWRKVYGV